MVALVACGEDDEDAADAYVPIGAPDAAQGVGLDATSTFAPEGGPIFPGNPDAATSPDGGAAAPTVVVQGGALRGELAGSTRVFLGVPYAAPPVAALRFAPPAAAPAWQGERDATRFAAACPQATPTGAAFGLPPLEQSEDCLFLNVYTPADAGDTPLPVMFWVHGGSGISGSGAEYDGRALSEAGKVVVVTINYRLGALASLALPALDAVLDVPSGNLALRDQQAALRWVHDNIAAFGGDPGSVTYFGESAGAIHGCLHMFASGSETLIHRYIMESGGCVGSAVSPATRAQAEATSQDLVTALCANQTDVVACLRGLSLDALNGYKNTRANVLEQIGCLHVDGELVPDHPAKLLSEGRYNERPILLGSNLHESNFLSSPAYKTNWPLVKDGIEFGIAVPLMYPDVAADVLFYYGGAAGTDANAALVDLMDHAWFRCPARALARGVTAQGGSAYLYSFEVLPGMHTQEIDYVFGFADGRVGKALPGAPVPPDADLVKVVQGYWLAFAKSGDPNGAGLPRWAPYDRQADQYLVLNSSIAMAPLADTADCDFWDARLVAPRQ